VKAIVRGLVDEAKALHALGIGTVAVMPNDTDAYPADCFGNMQAFARQHGLTFPYVIDETQDVARAYGAVRTPFFNAEDELRCHGRLDASRTALIAGPRRAAP
jgi:peroxiredoxin